MAGEPLKITVGYDALDPVPDAVMSIAVYDPMGNVIHGVDTDALGLHLPLLTGRGVVVFDLDYVPLLDGEYPFAISLSSRSGEHRLDWTDPEKNSFRSGELRSHDRLGRASDQGAPRRGSHGGNDPPLSSPQHVGRPACGPSCRLD